MQVVNFLKIVLFCKASAKYLVFLKYQLGSLVKFKFSEKTPWIPYDFIIGNSSMTCGPPTEGQIFFYTLLSSVNYPNSLQIFNSFCLIAHLKIILCLFFAGSTSRIHATIWMPMKNENLKKSVKLTWDVQIQLSRRRIKKRKNY